MKKFFILILSACVLLAGCNVLQPVENTGPAGQGNIPGNVDAAPVEVDFEKTDPEMFVEKDELTTYSENNSAVISLNGDTATSNANSVLISGSTVTITREGTYILRGSLNDGTVVINAGEKDKPHLIFEGVSITSSSSAALNVISAGKVYVTLAEGTENALVNGGTFAADENNVDGTLFSKQDLTINGSGSLTVTSPAGHGIVCKDDLAITCGNLTVNSAFHGLDANDSVRIKGGSITIDAGKDGIHAEDADNAQTGFVYISGGSIKAETEGDGISAALHMQISGGTLDILAGGGYENGEQHSSGGYGDFMGGGMGPGGMGPGGQRPGGRAADTTDTTDSGSMKGLKAGAGLLINGGEVTVDSADDALHSDTVTVINGGKLQLASGDDGIHAETDLNITAGTVSITNSYEGLEAQNILIAGGDISLVATDDGLNAAGGMDASGEGGRDQMMDRPGGMGGNSNGSVVISGGKLSVKASGDGIDANGYLQITGGYTVVCGPNSGDTATLDYDTGASITGGVFIGTGSSMMAQTFGTGSQGVIAIKADNQSAGAKITVTDANGKELLSHQPELPFAVFIFSSPDLVSGQNYKVTVGSLEGEVTAS